MNENELMHYGVKGMAWGEHRFGSESNGGMTKRQFKKELKSENRQAFKNGRTATIYGHALSKAEKRTAKAAVKYEKAKMQDPNGTRSKTNRLAKRLAIENTTKAYLKQRYSTALQNSKSHRDALAQKYGEGNVSKLKYSNGKVKERTISGKTWAKSVGLTIAGTVLPSVAGSPVGVAVVPRSGRNIGNRVYKGARRAVKGYID